MSLLIFIYQFYSFILFYLNFDFDLGETTSEVDSGISAHKFTKRQNTIEKQITLEDQAICGALQTLNEEAMEDVLDEREANLLAAVDLLPMQGYLSSNLSTCSDPAETDVLYLHTSVVPDLNFSGFDQASTSLGPRGFHGNILSIIVFLLFLINLFHSLKT